MNIVYIQLEKLKPYENNPRKIAEAVPAVKTSIEKFGFKIPVVVDRNNVIVAGHTRVAAAKELGMESVPAIVADDLTEEQIKVFRLVDNKTAELAEWDWNKLDAELEKVDDEWISSLFKGIDEKMLNDNNIEDLLENHYKYTCPCCGMKFNA